MVDGDADAYGEKGEAFHEQMGLKAGVAGKKLIPSVSTENGFYFSSGELGEEPGRHEGGIAEGFVEATINGGWWCSVPTLRATISAKGSSL
jgi:hypothetical protein